MIQHFLKRTNLSLIYKKIKFGVFFEFFSFLSLVKFSLKI